MDGSRVLFEASLRGSVTSLEQLLQEDPLLLDRYTMLNPLNDTPLHVASMLGHLDFVKKILTRKPELAIELNSRNSSPLHLASANGHVEIVKELLLVQPDMCLARDRDGWNPLHLAVIKGKVDVLKELLRVRVDAARATVGSGETILHLCVKHSKLDALKLLVETLSDDELLNSKNEAGLNILEVAFKEKQIEIIRILIIHTSMVLNELNGVRGMGISAESDRQVSDKEIMEYLKNAGAFEGNENKSLFQNLTEILSVTRELTSVENMSSPKWYQKLYKWLELIVDMVLGLSSLLYGFVQLIHLIIRCIRYVFRSIRSLIGIIRPVVTI